MDIQGGRGSPHTPWLARVQCDSRWMHTETPESDVMFPGQLYLCNGASQMTLGLPILSPNRGPLQLLAEAADATLFLAVSLQYPRSQRRS
jgi:hypothetical protein